MNKQNRTILFSGLILGLFAILGAALVSTTFQSTAEKIAANEKMALLRKLNQILPAENYDNDLLKSTLSLPADEQLGQKQPSTLYVAKYQNNISAMIFSVVTSRGYNGIIKMLVGINIDGTLAGVRIVSHKETPGLGDVIEITKSDWVLGFNGKSLHIPSAKDWKVKRDGGVFDQFTGATITPRAVVHAVHLCLVYFHQHRLALINQYNKTYHANLPENTQPQTAVSPN